MNVTEFLENWGRSLFEKPLGRGAGLESPPELAEIRLAILDEVGRHCYRAGSRQVFPYDLVQVSMRGLEEERAVVYRSGFFRQYLEHETQSRLRMENARFPESLRVEVDVTTGLPLPGEPWLTVKVGTQQPQSSPDHAARLVVQQGDAGIPELAIQKPRLFIGRDVDVYRNGALYRRNDLAFSGDTEVNRTVSREHAHIEFDRATGEYRLFNDRWYARGDDCGTRIVRNGLGIEVHRDSRGTRLRPGDEIHLGRAILIFLP
jgi:hypothetical protein